MRHRTGRRGLQSGLSQIQLQRHCSPHSHNLYLQIVCDAGIAALVIFVLLLYRFFRDMCASFCREKDWFTRLHIVAVGPVLPASWFRP